MTCLAANNLGKVRRADDVREVAEQPIWAQDKISKCTEPSLPTDFGFRLGIHGEDDAKGRSVLDRGPILAVKQARVMASIGPPVRKDHTPPPIALILHTGSNSRDPAEFRAGRQNRIQQQVRWATERTASHSISTTRPSRCHWVPNSLAIQIFAYLA
jgi:hypothetical protein